MSERTESHLAECTCPGCMPGLAMVGDVIQIRFLNEETGQEEVLGSAIVTHTGPSDDPDAIRYEFLASAEGD